METLDWWVGATVGLVAAWSLWWLSRSCHRIVMLQIEVDAAREAVYNFLQDPNNLKIVHPYTTGIRLLDQWKEGDDTIIDFIWMEKVLAAVETKARTTAMPSVCTICIYIHAISHIPLRCSVHVQWTFVDAAIGNDGSTESASSASRSKQPGTPANCSNVANGTSSNGSPDGQEAKHCVDSRNGRDNAAEPQTMLKFSTISDGCSKRSDEHDKTSQSEFEVSDSSINEKHEIPSERTTFKNTVTVKGPRFLAAILIPIVTRAQRGLMENVKQHLDNGQKSNTE